MQISTSYDNSLSFALSAQSYSDTYDTIFVIASYAIHYRCSNFVRQSVFVDKKARMIYFQDDDDGENCNDIMAF